MCLKLGHQPRIIFLASRDRHVLCEGFDTSNSGHALPDGGSQGGGGPENMPG